MNETNFLKKICICKNVFWKCILQKGFVKALTQVILVKNTLPHWFLNFFFDLVNEKQEFTCKNKKEGTYKSPSKCNKYYMCTGNSDMAIIRTCPKHTNFHPETKACVFTFSYSCEGKCALL